jgi:hypothetical protein
MIIKLKARSKGKNDVKFILNDEHELFIKVFTEILCEFDEIMFID